MHQIKCEQPQCHKNVITGTTASASWEPLCIFIPRSADPTNAAGAASTPKMNCGDVENNANKMIEIQTHIAHKPQVIRQSGNIP